MVSYDIMSLTLSLRCNVTIVKKVTQVSFKIIKIKCVIDSLINNKSNAETICTDAQHKKKIEIFIKHYVYSDISQHIKVLESIAHRDAGARRFVAFHAIPAGHGVGSRSNVTRTFDQTR